MNVRSIIKAIDILCFFKCYCSLNITGMNFKPSHLFKIKASTNF